jgi:5'(3')-deoxyribonucleotidase/uncharacterized protein with PQ loop repeat
MTWSSLIGTVAALSTTLALLPQLVKIKRQGGRDLSWAMLTMFLAGLCLWLTYGVLSAAPPIIAANLAALVLVSAIGVMKVVVDRPACDQRDGGARGGRPRRLRIAIDMDEVMADALSEHLRRYNTAFGTRLGVSDLRGGLEDSVPPAHRGALDAMLDATFFEHLDVMPDCQDVVRELAARHEVFIATAAMDVPCSFDAKYRWLQRHFPFIPPSHIVFCGDKSVIDADYLIDDRARHFPRFKGRPLLFSAPHNRDETGYPRVSSWSDVRDVFAERARSTPDASRPITWLRRVSRAPDTRQAT